jgi:hypothetical protein
MSNQKQEDKIIIRPEKFKPKMTHWEVDSFLGKKAEHWVNRSFTHSKPFYESQTTEIDSEGNIKRRVATTQSKLEPEPSFVKLYLDDITHLVDLPKTTSDVIFELLKLADYQQNIYIHKDQKIDICERLNIKESAVNKAITGLNKAQIILRKSRGHYILNPFFFGKGSWKDIREIRVKLLYNPQTLGLDIDVKISENDERMTGT